MASLTFPQSSSTVRVRAIDTRAEMSLHTGRFMEPVIENFETLNLTNICFLIEHPGKNKRFLFDCGIRKDFENYSPAIKARLNAILRGMKVDADITDILKDAGIGLDTLDFAIWSHWHWDHAMAEPFPRSVDVIVGPGFRERFMPGYPTVADSPCLDADFAGREVREVAFTDSSLRIGQFPALDLFGDGSFYLLDSPGHATGHICGLARTTPTTFVFMGGDICHFSGMFRPSKGLPLPDPIPPQQLDSGFPSPCGCSVFASQHPSAAPNSPESRTNSFFEVTSATPSSYEDRERAMESIRSMQDFDASPDVLVCIAHDPTLRQVLPFLNSKLDDDLNDWKRRGLKEKTLWGWLNELPRNGKPGRPMLVDACTRNGKRIDDFTKLEPTRPF